MPEREIQTSIAEKVGTKKLHSLELWRDAPCQCSHCQKVLNSVASKNAHLQFCPARLLPRFYKLGNKQGESYLFTILINPIRRRRNALQKVITDFNNPQIFLGAVSYLINEKIILDFKTLTLKESQKMIDYPNGRALFSALKSLLVQKEMAILEAQLMELNQEREIYKREVLGIKPLSVTV